MVMMCLADSVMWVCWFLEKRRVEEEEEGYTQLTLI